MGYRYDDLAPGEVYHVFSRGVEKRDIFLDRVDRERFVSLLTHCLPPGAIQSYSLAKRLKADPPNVSAGEGLVDLLCYCLMDNHFHLLLREDVEGGVSLYMRRLLTSYSRYFNVKRDRSGSLFIHPFKAVLVDSDEYLLHVSRYIHLNAYVAGMVKDIDGYEWSSLAEYVSSARSAAVCHRGLIRSVMGPSDYRSFVEDEADYAKSLEEVSHLLVDFND